MVGLKSAKYIHHVMWCSEKLLNSQNSYVCYYFLDEKTGIK